MCIRDRAFPASASGGTLSIGTPATTPVRPFSMKSNESHLGIGQNLLSMGAQSINVEDFAQAIKDVLENIIFIIIFIK